MLFTLFDLTDGADPINMSDTYLPPHIHYQLFPGALRGIQSITDQIPGQDVVLLVGTCCSLIFKAKRPHFTYCLTSLETKYRAVLSLILEEMFEQMISFTNVKYQHTIIHVTIARL